MAAGLLEGPLFPKLSSVDLVAPATSAVRALMIVWCFLAGFSERLVLALLAKTEDRASGQPSAGSDHFKPSSAAPVEGAPAVSKSAAQKESGKPDTPPVTGPTPPAATGA